MKQGRRELQTVEMWTRGDSSRRFRVHNESSVAVVLGWDSLGTQEGEHPPLGAGTRGLVMGSR
jgi:hypothetical protein